MKNKNTIYTNYRSLPQWISKTLFFLLLCIGHVVWLSAQVQPREFYGVKADALVKGADFVKQDPGSDYPQFVRFAQGKEIPFNDFFNWLSGERSFSQTPQFSLVKQVIDDVGIEHYRYVQTFQGIPVDKTHLYLHTKKGMVYGFDGDIRRIGQIKTTPKLSETQALQFAKEFVGASRYMWEDQQWEADLQKRKNDPTATHFPKGTLVIATPSGNMTDYQLAYVFNISALSPMKEVKVCVDATTGMILYDLPMESNCSAATVNTIFNGNRSISTELYDGTNYRLRDDCDAAVIHIRDWNSNDLTANPTEIENAANTWTTMNEIFGGTTLWCVKRSYNYYLNRFSRDSYDDADGDVSGLINALFNCAPPPGCITANNASMSFSGGNLKVGLSNAGVLTNSYATVDIMGHEYTHAVTGATAGLDYELESGALNESFSDIFGDAIEAFTFGAQDWLMGAERDNGAIRSLWNPNAGGQPDTYEGTNWVFPVPPCDGGDDNCGVHTNSGVQNFWFYLLVTGGTGTNDNGDNYTVNGIGLTDAEAIAYRNLVVYLGSTSDHADARAGSIQSAIDLFGLCSEQVRSTTNAWYAVGVGDPYLNVTATVTSDYNGRDVSCFGACDGAVNASAANGTAPYSYSWSNGATTQAISGLCAGTYSVTVTDATGCNAVGSVTLVNPPLLISNIGINSDYNGWPISCAGACDGIIEALPVGGTSPYTYEWSLSVGEQTTKIVSGLCAGLHSVTVTDANGCTATDDITLTEPPPLEIEAGPNQTIFYWDLSMACADLLATGATGGVPPYTYSWSSGSTTAAAHVCMEVREDTITIVTYYVTLTDDNGCTAVDSLNVCYVDINCGKGGSTKVEICHYPPDNPLNPQTLCVNLSSLVTHFAHGDDVASCDFVSPCDGVMPRIIFPNIADVKAGALIADPVLDVHPNPTNGYTQTEFLLHESQSVSIRLFDMHGMTVRTIYTGPAEADEIYQVGFDSSSLPPGLYVVRLEPTSTTKPLQKFLMIE